MFGRGGGGVSKADVFLETNILILTSTGNKRQEIGVMVYCTPKKFGHYKLAVLQFNLNYEQRKTTFNVTKLFLKVFLLRTQRCKSFTMPYLN